MFPRNESSSAIAFPSSKSALLIVSFITMICSTEIPFLTASNNDVNPLTNRNSPAKIATFFPNFPKTVY